MRENIDNKTGVTLRVSPLLDDLILSLDIRHNKEQKNKTVKILTFFCPESLLATRAMCLVIATISVLMSRCVVDDDESKVERVLR